MKLWHDDVRPPPSDEWSWARTNEEARMLLYGAKAYDQEITACSLDHDLGANPEDGICAKGAAEETGLKLVEWMIENDLVPPKVTIHSWNPAGARNMAQALRAAGHDAAIIPFVVSAQQNWAR